jgi:predicted esterase
LIGRTARAAVDFAFKSTRAGGSIPSAAAPIAIDMLKKMAITNAAKVLAAVLVVGLVAAGSAALAFPAQSRQPKAPDSPSASRKRSPRSEAVKSILSNGGFESGNPEGNSPEGWETGAEIDGVEYLWDRTLAHGERASLHLKKTAKRYFPIAQWSQEVKRSGTMPRLKVSAFVRATKMTKAVLDVQFINRDGSQTHEWAAYIGAKKASSPPVTHDWKKYEGVVKIPAGTEKLIVAAQIYGPGDVWFDDVVADYTNAEPTDPVGLAPSAPAAENPESDVADVPMEERKAGNDPRKRYLLIGPTARTEVSPEGYKLLLVLPGGDGSAEFRWFARRIAKNSLPRGYLVAELVAVSWTPEQFKQVVWPTAVSEMSQVGFTTEEFVDAVITDLAQSKTIDSRYVFALGWSSGGPPVYATSLAPGTRVTGSFVAMSVFREGALLALENARGRAYYLYHSPQDQLCPFLMAEEAARKLTANGATVTLAIYEGGHGWVGSVYEDIRSGIEWLENAQSLTERDRFRANQPIAARQTRAVYRGSGAGISTSESIVPE